MRTRSFIPLLLIVMVSGFVSATAFGVGGWSRQETPNSSRSGASDFAALDRGSAAIRTPDQTDPRGGPPWAVHESKTQDGRVCAKPGRRIGAQVGSPGRDGSLAGTDIGTGGVCTDIAAIPAERPVAVHVSGDDFDSRTGRRDPATFVWGLAREEVTRIKLTTAAGTRSVPVTAGGAFIAVFPGLEAAATQITVEATLDDQDARSFALPAPSASIRQRILNPPSTEQIEREVAAHEAEK